MKLFKRSIQRNAHCSHSESFPLNKQVRTTVTSWCHNCTITALGRTHSMSKVTETRAELMRKNSGQGLFRPVRAGQSEQTGLAGRRASKRIIPPKTNINYPWRTEYSPYKKKKKMATGLLWRCDVTTKQSLPSAAPPACPWSQKHKQHWCGIIDGSACSGLWELTNQSRLGFVKWGALKRQALKQSIQTVDV